MSFFPTWHCCYLCYALCHSLTALRFSALLFPILFSLLFGVKVSTGTPQAPGSLLGWVFVVPMRHQSCFSFPSWRALQETIPLIVLRRLISPVCPSDHAQFPLELVFPFWRFQRFCHLPTYSTIWVLFGEVYFLSVCLVLFYYIWIWWVKQYFYVWFHI